jgi:hypothetical protein
LDSKPIALPADTRTIQLLSELPPPAPTPVCESFGPFDNEGEVERTTSEIIAKGLDPIVKEEEAGPDEADGYLVYIDTPSRSEANRIQRELQSRAIDCAIIPTGRLADSLSVGVFQQRELADAHLRRLTELGYRADLETLTRSRKLYRVFAPSAACGV